MKAKSFTKRAPIPVTIPSHNVRIKLRRTDLVHVCLDIIIQVTQLVLSLELIVVNFLCSRSEFEREWIRWLDLSFEHL